MKLKHLRFPLVKLPADTQLVLCLLREELKSTKFFNGLSHIGLDDSYYEPHLSTVVLACMGFEEVTDELMEFYLELLGKYSEKIEADNDSIMKQAMKMYIELVNKKTMNN